MGLCWLIIHFLDPGRRNIIGEKIRRETEETYRLASEGGGKGGGKMLRENTNKSVIKIMSTDILKYRTYGWVRLGLIIYFFGFGETK